MLVKLSCSLWFLFHDYDILHFTEDSIFTIHVSYVLLLYYRSIPDIFMTFGIILSYVCYCAMRSGYHKCKYILDSMIYFLTGVIVRHTFLYLNTNQNRDRVFVEFSRSALSGIPVTYSVLIRWSLWLFVIVGEFYVYRFCLVLWQEEM